METTGRVVSAFLKHRPTSIKVDVVGIGAGVVDRLREMGYPVVGIESAARARDAHKFTNLKAEIWDGFAQLMRQGLVALPPDDVLAGQLAAIKYKYASSGQLQIESKDDLKKRVGYSPDRADALVYAFADLRGTSLSEIEQPMQDSRWTDWQDGSRWRV
jgi:phage terminase large subunit